VLWSSFGHASAAAKREQSFFTADDGKTWFAEDASKLTPFDHDGKEAVRAHVFVSGGKKWVAYLERCTPEGRKAMEAVEKNPGATAQMRGVAMMEVKRPGETTWSRPTEGKKYADIVTVADPNGGNNQPRQIGPAD
jgi:hypothetical protein